MNHLPSMIWIGLGVIAVVMLLFYIKSGRPFRTFAFSAATGIGTLALLQAFSPLFGGLLSLTPFSISVSALLGLPGVIGMLFLKLMMGI